MGPRPGRATMMDQRTLKLFAALTRRINLASSPITITAVADPYAALATTAMNLGTEWFKYLQTPAGQQWAMQENAMFAKFNQQVSGFFDHVQAQIAAQKAGG